MTALAKDLFELIASMFGMFLTHVEFGAVALGTLVAISVTQVVKMLVIKFAPTNGGRWLWYSVSFVLGLVATWSNWPTVLGFWWGVVSGGGFAPTLYIIATRLLYRFAPDAERQLSATPTVTK